MIPIFREHEGIFVIRDDLFPGGTKARFLPKLFEDVDEVVYASPAEGGAQTALAQVAADLGKKATIFVAKRQEPHARTLMAKRLGAKILQVAPGYLSVVQARARDYADARGALLAPFGMNLPYAVEAIAAAARSTKLYPAEVWCASGSGVLARGLSLAWPNAKRHVVQVGRDLDDEDVAGARIHTTPIPFEKLCPITPPFPSDPHYDAKAWQICRQSCSKNKGLVVFWNVTGPAF